jgi:hypothetical protein
MADQVIIRRKVTSNFTVLDNTLITDKRLSWKALGLLTFLLSLPPDFKLRLNHLSKQRTTGRDATRSGLKELEDVGYLQIAIERHPDGKFACTTWTVSDRPNSDLVDPSPQPGTENPKAASQDAGKPKAAKPVSRYPTLTSTSTNKEHILQKTTTTDQLQKLQTTLIFPAVSAKELESIEKIVSDVPAEYQQDLLDEIEGKRRTGKLRNGAVALTRYLSKNLDQFLLIDGHTVQLQRENKEKQIKAEALRQKDAVNKDAEIGSSLGIMSDEEFEEKHRGIPENIRKRIEIRRQEEIVKLKNKSE